MPATPPDPFAAGRFVRHLDLRVERLDGENAGKLRVSTPNARGWAVVVRGPDQLWWALQTAVNEATIAGYARWQGGEYDHDALTEQDDPTEPSSQHVLGIDELSERAALRRTPSYSRHSVSRPDVADPADWRPNSDGSWRSPKSGKSWRPETRMVRRVLKKRRVLGLPMSYEEYIEMTGDAQ